MDVESKRPLYAGVLISNSTAINGDCFKVNKTSYDFLAGKSRILN